MRNTVDTESHHSASPEQTGEIAAAMAAKLAPGDVVLLRGELGSGKSVFVRGAAAALGFTGRVTSPTFAIGNVYPVGDDLEIAHLDLYRLDDIGISDGAVLDDFLTDERIVFIEWPHVELADDSRLRATVRLAHAGDDARTIEIEWIEASR